MKTKYYFRKYLVKCKFHISFIEFRAFLVRLLCRNFLKIRFRKTSICFGEHAHLNMFLTSAQKFNFLNKMKNESLQ